MDKRIAEESFVFYRSFFEAMEGMADGDKLALFDAIARMGLYGEEAVLPLEAKRLFLLILPQLRANRKKRVAGRRGGRPQETGGSARQGTNGSLSDKPNEKEKETEKEKEKEKERASISPADAGRARTMPTLGEIEAYCHERGNRVNARRFYDFYTANGWRVGKNAMRDWKAAVRGWETNGVDDARAPAREDKTRDTFLAVMEMARREEAKLV